ncbi:MAG: fucose-binding lectin II [Vulcanimicrobiaceae bacterium]|jgi:hypothetical protein
MPWTMYLPFSTRVYIYGFTNAGLNQQITVVPESGSTLTFTGSGENNRATTPPNAIINTPSSGSNPRGFKLTVTIKSYKNGNWVESQITGAGASLGIVGATYMVCSEDLVDNDWNDGVLSFIWYNPPPTAAEFAQHVQELASAQ